MKFSSARLLPFVLLFLAACSSTGNNAPVIDRQPSRVSAGDTSGTYTVKAGDTLYAIALEHGQDWRELAKVNNLADPSKIFVGQKLKVENAQESAPSSGVAAKSGGDNNSDTAPAGIPIASPSGVSAQPIPVDSSASAAPTPQPAPTATASSVGQGDFGWPHPGAVIQGYKAGVNKGIDFAAKVGDPVLASQAGKVVYSGNALRGYGNLIIIKHDNNLLTAYAHNKTLLVKEGDAVKKGQKIAEAGQSDTDKPKLHFEVRKGGKPVDPMEYLPAR